MISLTLAKHTTLFNRSAAKAVFIYTLTALFVFPVYAQNIAMINSPLINQSLNYSKDNNIYFWRGLTAVSTKAGPGIFSMTNELNISQITSLSLEDKWKDINRFESTYRLPLTPLLNPVFKLSSNYLTDRQSGFLNNITEHHVSVETPLILKNRVSIKPKAGFAWDKRLSTGDNGLFGGFDLEMRETLFGDYSGKAQAHFVEAQLGDHR